MKRKFQTLCKLTLLVLFASCGKESFVASTRNEKISPSASSSTASLGCADYTKVKPPVDFLFVVDNSGSANFLSGELKSAIQTTVNTISQEFDYHIMVAPLIDVGVDNTLPIVAATPQGLGSVLNRIVTSDQLQTTFFGTSLPSGSDEKGFLRVKNLISSNMSNGIFRKNAYTVVVLVSNGDDADYIQNSYGYLTQDYYAERLLDLKKFTKKYQTQVEPSNSSLLAAEQFHFISVVAHRGPPVCPNAAKWGARYNKMSCELYNYVFGSSENCTPVNAVLPKVKSFDLCYSSEVPGIFAQINSSIQSIILAHKYDHWPISTTLNFDRNSVVVKKNGVVLTKGDILNGWILHPDLMANQSAGAVTQNTRYEPTAGVPFTGYMVKLFGSARSAFNPSTMKPDCIEITSSAPKEWYGYVRFERKPDLSTVKIRKNGVDIAQSSTNGWSDFGQSPSLNIQIVCAENTSGTVCTPSSSNYQAASPGRFLSGYFLKVYGQAIYSNYDKIEIDYKPASN